MKHRYYKQTAISTTCFDRSFNCPRHGNAFSIKTIICLLFFILTLSNSFSQEIIHTLEAENAVLTLPSKIKRVNGYSNNAYVGDNDAGSAIVFNNVHMEREGTYEFRTYYTSMHIRSIAIYSGYYPAIISTCPIETEDWNRPPVGVMVTYIYLNAGNNTLKITPHNGGGPNVDKFEIIETSVSMTRPEPLKLAYAYDLTDDAVITTNATTDNLDYLTDNDESTVYSFNTSSAEITINCDMPYLLTGYFLSAGLESSQNVKNWKLEYSTDGNTYSTVYPTQIDELENGALFHISRNSHSDKHASAQHYRLTAYGGKIGEIQLFGIPYLSNADNKNFPLDLTQGLSVQSNTLGDPLGVYQYGSFDERYYNLFDRDMSQKYYWGNASSFWVDVELEQANVLNYYTLTSCQDYPERDPKSWVVEGFDGDWEIVSEVSNFEFPTRYACMKFYVESNKAYKGYRLRVTQNNGSEAFQLLKWQLFGGGASSVTTTEEDKSFVYSLKNEIRIKPEGKGEFQIFNLSGRLVVSGKTDTQELRLPLEQGLYIVKLIAAGKNKVEKVIVR